MAVANTEVSRCKRAARQIRSKHKFTCGGQVMREEQDLEVDIVHGRFTHRGDSILSAFFSEPLQKKLQD